MLSPNRPMTVVSRNEIFENLPLRPFQSDNAGRRGRPRTYLSPTPPPAFDVELLEWGRIACLEPRGVYVRPKRENTETKEEKRARLAQQRQELLQRRLQDDERRMKKKKKRKVTEDAPENVWQVPSPSPTRTSRNGSTQPMAPYFIQKAFGLPDVPQFQSAPRNPVPSVLPLPRETSVPAQLAATFRHLDTVTANLNDQRRDITQTAAKITQHKLGLDTVHAQLQSLQRSLDEKFAALDRETTNLETERQQLLVFAQELDQEVEIAGDYVREFATQCDKWVKHVARDL
jgi:hypothetical protein